MVGELGGWECLGSVERMVWGVQVGVMAEGVRRPEVVAGRCVSLATGSEVPGGVLGAELVCAASTMGTADMLG